MKSESCRNNWIETLETRRLLSGSPVVDRSPADDVGLWRQPSAEDLIAEGLHQIEIDGQLVWARPNEYIVVFAQPRPPAFEELPADFGKPVDRLAQLNSVGMEVAELQHLLSNYFIKIEVTDGTDLATLRQKLSALPDFIGADPNTIWMLFSTDGPMNVHGWRDADQPAVEEPPRSARVAVVHDHASPGPFSTNLIHSENDLLDDADSDVFASVQGSLLA